MSTSTLPEYETFIQQEVERAVAPYRKVAPPSIVAMLRDVAERYWRTHPQGVAIARALTRAAPQQSQMTGARGAHVPARPSPTVRRKG